MPDDRSVRGIAPVTSGNSPPPGLPAVLRRLRLRDLETLVLLGHSRSFGLTAETIGMSQPALSRWLRELERELDAELFERTTRRVTPTRFGSAVIGRAERALCDLGALPDLLTAMREGLKQAVLVGMIPGLAPVLIPAAVELLEPHRDSPQIRLEEATLDQMLPRAQRHEIDIVICRPDSSAMAAGLFVEPLYADRVRVCCGAKHPLGSKASIDWEDAARFPWIMPRKASPMRVALELEFSRCGVPMPLVVLESVSLQTNLALCRRMPCLFVASAQSLKQTSGRDFRFLPLQLGASAPTVSALYARPTVPAIEHVLGALRRAALPLQQTTRSL